MSTQSERGFLAENWLWIVVPFLLVMGGLAALLMTFGEAGGDGSDPTFIYPVF
ncbi:hypothetical protein [Engelhardtia mirabilis]|uniref:Uncharacterized protein n=1 Tax=Engelhardtia mirabilis TaxID=2528011 RepID=A0A518BK92_9BACT|nr:hypothetical protein Pla133_24730 [Planctomycetes bacterium Pla133]QDV01717.1 hypothetical protein Pla86_24720 [Planctomycetes bacterium Pla86]